MHARRLPTVLLGALMLPLAFLPTAAFADSAPAPVVTATATATTSPEPVITTDPSPSVTATPAPSVTATPEPTDPAGDILSGEFGMQPGSGKPGTVITVKSKTACLDSAGKIGPQVEVVMFNENDLTPDGNPLPTVDKVISTDSSGGWTTTATVPAKAKAGDLYLVDAACFAAGTDANLNDGAPFLIYDFQEFTVTEADKAPVASPVPGDPNFTG